MRPRFIKVIRILSVVLISLYILMAGFFITVAVAPPTEPAWQGFVVGFTETIFGEPILEIDLPTLVGILGGMVLEMLPYGLILFATRGDKPRSLYYYVVVGFILFEVGLHLWDFHRPPILPLVILGLLLSKSAREYFGLLKKAA